MQFLIRKTRIYVEIAIVLSIPLICSSFSFFSSTDTGLRNYIKAFIRKLSYPKFYSLMASAEFLESCTR